jgi:hypothetical protein
MMAVAGAVFALVAPSRRAFEAQPEVHDLQQRLRVAFDTLHRGLIGAGAGVDTGPVAGPLHRVLAPILPYRFPTAADGERTPRSDGISLTSVSSAQVQARVVAIASLSTSTSIQVEPNCAGGNVCGFTAGLPVVILDATGHATTGVVETTDGVFVVVDGADAGGINPAVGAVLAAVEVHSYWLDPASGSEPPRLMHFDGRRTSLPVVDHIVALEFEYFGDPQPPALLPGSDLAQPVGPWTTYGPRPPLPDQDDARDEWPAGENCVFVVAGGVHTARLPALAASRGPVPLPLISFADGPWCPDARHPYRYDADLFRIRRIRVRLRVEAADDGLRGPSGALFMRGGTGVKGLVPDQAIAFDVSPRNLSLGVLHSPQP